MQNHLILGLGGTGCAVVRELHKRLFVEWSNRQQISADRKAAGASERPDVYEFSQRIGAADWKTRVATLSVDSNQDELEGGQDEWRVLGEQITLKDTERFLLQKEGVGQMLRNLSRYPGTEPWVAPDRDLIDEITKGGGKPEGCDQIRRLGKLVYADRANWEGLAGKVMKRVGALREGGTNEVTLHLCATLGCGTGSGVLVDVITQLRKHLALNAANFPIFLYVFITGEDVKADVGNFHANQYGALQELNALRRGYYKPWDLSNESESVRINVIDAFQSCFLISGVTDGGQVLSLDDQVNSAGEFLFQKFARLVGNMPAALLNAHSFQDVTPFPEDNRENNSGRSTRFASFGIRRLGIPDQEIHKKLALTFSEQGALALAFDNWDSQIGFANTRKSGFDSDKFVRESLAGWTMTDRQLSLDDCPGYPTYADEWLNRSGLEEEQTKAMATNFRQWDELFRKKLELYREKGMRGSGLDNFFKPKSEDNSLAERAKELIRIVERSLLEGWLAGKADHVTDNFAAIVSTTKGQLERYQQAFKERLNLLPVEIDKQEKLRDFNANNLENVGLLTKIFTKKHENIFQAYCVASRMIYTLRSEQRSAEYADKLIDKMLPALDALRERVEKVDTLFKKLAVEWSEESKSLLKKREEADAKAAGSDLIHYVNHDEVSRTIRTLTLDKPLADTQARSQRLVLDRLRGQSQDFAFVLRMLTTDAHSNRVTGDLRQQLERASYIEAHEAHKTYEQKRDAHFKPVLRLNIVKKLHDDHGGLVSDKLKSQLKELMAGAMPALAFDASAQPVEHGPKAPIHRCSLFIPQCAALGESNFREQLCTELRSMQGNYAREIEIYDVPEERNSSEIVFLSTAHFFPLRMALPVVALKKRFEAKLKKDERRRKFLHFGETHRLLLPDLMMADDGQLKREALPYLTLAVELSLFHIVPGDDLDDWAVVLGEKNKYGEIEGEKKPSGETAPPPSLGMKCTVVDRDQAKSEYPLADKTKVQLPIELVALLNGHQHFDAAKLPVLKGRVLTLLPGVCTTTAERKRVTDLLDTHRGYVFASRGERQADPLYTLYASAVTEAKGIIEAITGTAATSNK